MSLTLDPALEARIQREVDLGHFPDADTVINAALDLFPSPERKNGCSATTKPSRNISKRATPRPGAANSTPKTRPSKSCANGPEHAPLSP